MLWLGIALLFEPEAPVPRVITEAGPSPLYYRLPDNSVRLLTRSALGQTFRSGESAFTFDVLGGSAITFARDGHAGLAIELGYSYARFHDHQALLGVGPALFRIGPKFIDEGAVNVMLIPHAVIGRFDGTFGYGVRTSAIVGYAAYGIELAHQYTIAGDRRIHEVQLLFTAPFVGGGG
jgi:hypothetical protein